MPGLNFYIVLPVCQLLYEKATTMVLHSSLTKKWKGNSPGLVVWAVQLKGSPRHRPSCPGLFRAPLPVNITRGCPHQVRPRSRSTETIALTVNPTGACISRKKKNAVGYWTLTVEDGRPDFPLLPAADRFFTLWRATAIFRALSFCLSVFQ